MVDLRFGRSTAVRALEAIDARRRRVVLDPWRSCGTQGVHPGTLGLVARALPVRGYLLHRRAHKKKSIAPRQGQVDPKAFGVVQNRLLPAKDLI